MPHNNLWNTQLGTRVYLKKCQGSGVNNTRWHIKIGYGSEKREIVYVSICGLKSIFDNIRWHHSLCGIQTISKGLITCRIWIWAITISCWGWSQTCIKLRFVNSRMTPDNTNLRGMLLVHTLYSGMYTECRWHAELTKQFVVSAVALLLSFPVCETSEAENEP